VANALRFQSARLSSDAINDIEHADSDTGIASSVYCAWPETYN